MHVSAFGAGLRKDSESSEVAEVLHAASHGHIVPLPEAQQDRATRGESHAVLRRRRSSPKPSVAVMTPLASSGSTKSKLNSK